MHLPRFVLPDLLDRLPNNDPNAIEIRRDLKTINSLAGNVNIIAGNLQKYCAESPRVVIDIGSGDGNVLLRVARRLAPRWKNVTAILVDQYDAVSKDTRDAFAALGWKAKPTVADRASAPLPNRDTASGVLAQRIPPGYAAVLQSTDLPVNAHTLERLGPVHFQSLEWELQQVRQYIKGKVLNAGCGNRDVGDTLRGFGAGEIINYDIESSIPGAIRGSLTEIPFASGEFDTIICNAVLEHVPEIERVMQELTRVLKYGGYFVASVPFLQPYHRSPTDFRRYTGEGLEEMGRLHGLRTVEILPVHSITQTLGWIAWEWAKEKGGWRAFGVYPIVWLSTRLFYKTDMRVRYNANTFQVIYTKEG